MDPSKDNPVKRIKAFVWVLSAFLLFGIILIAVAFVYKKTPATLEDLVAKSRYITRTKIEASQDLNLSYKVIEERKFVQVPPSDVFSHVGAQLFAVTPTAVERPDQVIPDSPTAQKLASNQASIAPLEIKENDPNTPIDPAIMAEGKVQFALCMACHSPAGAGVPGLAPPLAGSEWVLGPVENPIRIVLRGLGGPIKVKDVDYNLPAPMAPAAYLTDEQISSVLTYVRNSFGNKASAVSADQVKAFRSEVGKPILKVSDLKDPK
jgi:mono/diheme cytochrome c family protein